MNSSLRKTLRSTVMVVQGIILLACLLLILLQSVSVQGFVLNHFILPENTKLDLKGFKGFFPLNVYYDDIVFSQGGVKQLEMKALSLDLSTWKTVSQGGLYIESFIADSIVYHELQPLPKSTKANKAVFVMPQIPSIPIVVIEGLDIKKMQYISKSEVFTYRSSGRLSKKENKYDFVFAAENIDKPANSINLKAGFASEGNVNVKLLVNEGQGGFLSYLLANGAPIGATLNINSIGSDLDGSLNLKLGSVEFAGNIRSAVKDMGQGHQIKVNGQYKNNDMYYQFVGSALSDNLLQNFDAVSIKITDAAARTFLASGNFSWKDRILSSDSLNLKALIGSEIQINTNNKFRFNSAAPSVNLQLLGEVVYGNNDVAKIKTDLFVGSSAKNTQLNFAVDADLSSFGGAFKENGIINFSGNLDKKALERNEIRLPIKLKNNLGFADVDLLYNSNLAANISGDFLSNLFKIQANLSTKSFKLTANNISKNMSQTIVPNKLKLELIFGPQPILNTSHTVSIAGKSVESSAKGLFDGGYSRFSLESFKAQYKESFLEAKGDIDLSSFLGGVDWHFYSFNLGDVFDSAFSGSLSTNGRYEFGSQDSAINFKGDFHKLFLGDAALEKGTFSGFIHPSKNNQLSLSLNAKQFSYADILIEDFSLNSNGVLDNFSTTLSMVGVAEKALRGNVAFSLSNLSELELDSLVLNLGKDKLMLNSPFKVLFLEGGIKLSPALFNTAKGQIMATGSILNNQLDLLLKMKNVPGELLSSLTQGGYFLNGMVNSNLAVSGSLEAPTVKGDFRSEYARDSVEFNFRYDNHIFLSDVHIKTPGLDVDLNSSLPVKFSFKKLDFRVDKDKPFKSKLKISGDISNFNRVFGLSYDKVYGQMNSDLSVEGSISKPAFSGRVKVKNGQYKRESLGLVLQDINFTLLGQGAGVALKEPVKFRDTQKGKLTLKKLDLLFNRDFSPILSTWLRFDQVQFVSLPQTRSGGMDVIASGLLKLEGPFSNLNIYVRGNIDSFEKYIGNTTSVPIYKVNTVYKKTAASDASNPISEEEFNTSGLIYDIKLVLDKKFRIFGQGLDSNWGGSLDIMGSSSKPIYKGLFSLKDGEVRILDKLFNVQKGRVQFDGDLSPSLYVEAGLNLPDIRVSIIIEGEDDIITQRIISDQNLTEQEILQRLFFNRSSTLSQSLQVMNLLASQSFISSLVDIGFYQKTNPITHKDYEYISLKRKLFEKSYVNVDVSINNNDGLENKVSLSTGYNFNKSTKAKVRYAPGEKKVGLSLVWEKDF